VYKRQKIYWETHGYNQIHDILDKINHILYASDYTSIDNAFVGLSDSSGGNLYIPNNTYTIGGDSLGIVGSSIIEGEGYGAALYQSDGNMIIKIDGEDYGVISNLRIYTTANGGNSNEYGIYFNDSDNWIIFNCVFDGFGTSAIKMAGTSTDILIIGCKFTNNAVDIDGANTYTILGCDGVSNRLPGNFVITGFAETDTIKEATSNYRVTFPDGIVVDTVRERTVGNNIVLSDEIKVDTVLSRTDGADVVFPNGVVTDTIHGTSDLYLNVGANTVYYQHSTGALEVLDEGDVASIKDPFWLGEDIFPLTQLVYKDSTFNNIDSTNYITVSSVSGTGDTRNVVFNWLPYRTGLFSPVSGQEWAVVISNSWGDTGTEPNMSGDATELLVVNSGTYSTKTLNLTDRTTWSISAGDTCVIYNPFSGAWEWCTEPLFSSSGAGWRATYISPGPIYMHSDGYLRMLVNGLGQGVQRVGLVKFHPDSIFTASAWHVQNSDAAVFDTSTALSRSVGVLCTSVLESINEDCYIGYTMQSDGSSQWEVGYIKFDEDGNIIEDLSSDILTSKPPNSDWGQGAPYVVRYGSTYHMLFANRDSIASRSSLTHNNTTIFEATATLPTGPFVCTGDSILPNHYDNKISYRSNHADMAMLFPYKNRLYALIGGTSCWHQSGSKANRQWGLAYRDERGSTTSWIEDSRNPLWINIMQKYGGWDSYDPIWGTGQGILNNYYYASDHSGGYPSFYSNPDDGYIYIFFGCNASTDDYHIWGMRLNANEW